MIHKVKKVLSMSPGEISFRLREQIRIRQELARAGSEFSRLTSDDFQFISGKENFVRFKKDAAALLNNPAFMRRPGRPLGAEETARFRELFPEEFRKSIQRADQFLEHKFRFLGAEFQLPDPIPWQSDPISLNPYPAGFYRKIDIFTNRNAGDVKHVWEVNRLQFLIEIAKAFYLTGERKYKTKLENLLLDWIEKNPYKQGIAWASALEVGVRVSALIWTLHFYISSRDTDQSVLFRLVKLIYLSARFLDENLSIYFSPYNHLIGETAGLYFAGYIFPEFRDAARFEKKAGAILTDQVNRQFHPDGGCVEQATFYHHFTLGFYLQAMAFKRLAGEPVDPVIAGRSRQALDFILKITKPDGRLPWLGDIDDARSIYFTDPMNWDFRFFQALGAVFFNRPDLKWRAGYLPEELFWLLPEQDFEAYRNLAVQTPVELNADLADSGYAVFRSGQEADSHFAMIDCGPLAHGVFHDDTPSAAHGHADELAVELAVFGESFLIDPGFSNYRGDFNWHSYFRSTAAHNTLTINEKSQARQGGILVWSRAPQFRRINWFSGNVLSGFVGEHYGYTSEPGQPVHRRQLAFVNNSFWIVIDDVFSRNGTTAPTRIEQFWHCDPAVNIRQEGEALLVMLGRTANLTLVLHTEKPAQTRIVRGGENAPDGWVSPTYRAVQPAPVISHRFETNLPLRLVTLLIPGRGENSVTVKKSNGHYEFELSGSTYQVFPEATTGLGERWAVVVEKDNQPVAGLNRLDLAGGQENKSYWFNEF